MVRRWTRQTCRAESESDLSWVPPHVKASEEPRTPSSEIGDESEVEEIIINDEDSSRRRNLRGSYQGANNSRSLTQADRLAGDLAILGVGAALLLSSMWIGVIVVAIVYPLIETIKSLDKGNREHERRWVVYWVVFAISCMLYWIPKMIFGWIPGYSVAIMYFFWWLSRNNAENANYLYESYGHPLFKWNEETIDRIGEEMVDYLGRMGKMAVIKMNSALAPVARKLETATKEYHRELDGKRRIGRSRRHR